MTSSPNTNLPAKNSGPRRRTRWLLAVAGVATVGLIVAGVSIGSGPGGGSAAGAAQPRTSSSASRGSLHLYEVTRSDFDITTTATGDLRARKQINIQNTVESETTITEIIAEGTSVKKGDVLIRLNAESIQQRLDEESLQLENARAAVIEANEAYEIQVSENESAKRAAELKLALARLELQKWEQGEVRSKEQELKHALERAEKDEERLRDYLDKSRRLFEREFYSADKLKQDELALEQAVAATEKARLAKDIHERFEKPKDQKQKNSDVEEAQAEVERVVRQNSSRIASKEADKKNKQQALTIREQKFNKLREQLDAATIKAPSDGLVVYATSLENARWGGDEGPLQVGSKVYQNQTLIVLPDTSEMIAAVRVHESLAGRIRKGQPAAIRIDAMGERRFTGTVEEVGILAEQTSRWMDPTLREYTVRILLDIPPDMIAHASEADAPATRTAASHGLRPSMRCEAEIVLGKVADSVTVPLQSVHSEGLLRFVHVADSTGTRYTRRPVMVGQRSDRFAEIRAGLNPGERVLLRKPETGEILDKSWNPQELAAVGLEVNSSGDIVPSAAAMAARAGGPGTRPANRPQRPAGPTAAAEQPAPAPGDSPAPAAEDGQEKGAGPAPAAPAESQAPAK